VSVVAPLVVGVDGSHSSLRAVDWGAGEAARLGLPLRLVHASVWEHYEGARPSLRAERPSERVLAEHIVASCEERVRVAGPAVQVTGEIVPEDPVNTLLREARSAYAVVVGSRGRGGLAGALLGSVSRSVAARALCPVIVVRGAEPNLAGGHHRVVLGVGEDTDCAAAARFAFRAAEVRDCPLYAIRAWRSRHPDPSGPGELYDALPGAAPHGLELHRELVEGPPHRVLVEATRGADLLVVGATRRHARFGPQLGRVAHALLQHADSPVAVVPQRL
jgi:nucleotide-binding universal stress UspA family protein